MLHHIDTQCDSGVESYPNAVKAVEDAFRVLKPSGLLMIDMHSEEQASRGYWFYSLVPKAAAKFKRKVIPEGKMFDSLRAAGNLSRNNYNDAIIRKIYYWLCCHILM